MIEGLLVFPLMLVLVGAMSIGVLLGREPIRGTCGGLSPGGSCELCGNDPAQCDAEPEQAATRPPSAAARSYDATERG